jgi:hypothetical protein
MGSAVCIRQSATARSSALFEVFSALCKGFPALLKGFLALFNIFLRFQALRLYRTCTRRGREALEQRFRGTQDMSKQRRQPKP